MVRKAANNNPEINGNPKNNGRECSNKYLGMQQLINGMK